MSDPGACTLAGHITQLGWLVIVNIVISEFTSGSDKGFIEDFGSMNGCLCSNTCSSIFSLICSFD